jgi:ammonium transporter, Amt family
MKRAALLLGIILALAMPACAQQSAPSGGGVAAVDSGSTAWLLTSTALVLLMTVPGLALFYGGMVRKKNVLSTFYHSLSAAIVVSATWILGQYAFAFGTDSGGLIGWAPGKFLMSEVTPSSVVSPGGVPIPEVVFAAYQMMFAVITVALIAGALVERLSFKAWILFVFLWTLLVYTPLAHWVWGGGWLSTVGNLFGLQWNMKPVGTLDFAGGLVVHVSSGVAALVALGYLGPRANYEREPVLPQSVSMTFIGAGLLWFGWFGFNAGSALAANGSAGYALLATNTAAVFAALAWIVIEWATVGKPSVIGGVSGLVAGLATITPAAGYVDIKASILIGLIAGALAWFFVSRVKKRLRYDDSLDVFNIHGMGGTVGLLLAGVFANPAVSGGAAGLFFGNPGQLVAQLVGVVSGYLYSGVVTFLILLFIDKALRVRIRVSEAEERQGLDYALHGERESNDE